MFLQEVQMLTDSAWAGSSLAEPLEGYVGPMSYRKPGTNFWLFRWHQTW